MVSTLFSHTFVNYCVASSFILLWKSSDSTIYCEHMLFKAVVYGAPSHTHCADSGFFVSLLCTTYARLCGISKNERKCCMNAMNQRKNALTHQVNRNDVSFYHFMFYTAVSFSDCIFILLYLNCYRPWRLSGICIVSRSSQNNRKLPQHSTDQLTTTTW